MLLSMRSCPLRSCPCCLRRRFSHAVFSHAIFHFLRNLHLAGALVLDMGFHGLADRLGNPGIKGLRHDKVLIPLLIGNQAGNGFSGGQLHFLRNLGSPAFQCALEDARESHHIVHLVGEIAAPGIISGTGFAIAKRIASWFIEATISAVTMPGAETPTKISAPFKASARVPD